MLNNLSEPAGSTAAIDHYVSVTENKSVPVHFFAASQASVDVDFNSLCGVKHSHCS